MNRGNDSNHLNKKVHLHLLLEDKQGTVLLIPGIVTTDYLETCVKSIFLINDPNTRVVGLKEAANEDENNDDTPILPLQVICFETSLIDPSKWYTPHFYISASQTSVQSLPMPLPLSNNESHPSDNQNYNHNAHQTNHQNGQHWGYYGDPWQNDEYFGQYGKLVLFSFENNN